MNFEFSKACVESVHIQPTLSNDEIFKFKILLVHIIKARSIFIFFELHDELLELNKKK